MASLTHWDFAAHFSGNDAAALILGIEPRESDDDDSRIRVVIDRMELHYNHARKRHYQEAFDLNSADFMDTEASRPFELESVRMSDLSRQWDPREEVSEFSDWLASNHRSQFEDQIFSRHVVADWLSAIKLESIYQFKLDQPSNENEVTGQWPWGGYHTDLLGHLEAAARQFWMHYDPSDETYPPTNDTVIDWLKNEHKVSDNMAKAMATMLRPDGLRTGPRKELSDPINASTGAGFKGYRR